MDAVYHIEKELLKEVEAVFDDSFYRRRYGAVGSKEKLLEHFLTIGWIQGRDPSPFFSVLTYLQRHDDVVRRHLNPLIHYLFIGKDEGRSLSPSVEDYDLFLPWDSQIAELLPMWFDEDYYLTVNPELRGCPNPLAQFLVLGWVEGRDPSRNFSTHKYLWKYSDVWFAGENPLIHYLRVGRSEGREMIAAEGSRLTVPRHLSDAEWLDLARSEFDQDFYARTYPSLKHLSDLFGHYCTTGWLEGRDPSGKFSVRHYLAAHSDVRSSGREPLLHWVRHGRFEGRKTFPSDAVPEPDPADSPSERVSDDAVVREAFDPDFYVATYPELASVEDCFSHYMSIGWKEGRNPSANFDTSFYLRNEGDIREAGINPFRHYILHGKREGRKGVHRLPKIVDLTDYPRVTAIVPNYNHARFLPSRLQSICEQAYPNLELLLLDDCSSDNSREVLEAFAASYSGECKLVFNEVNSGNVFAQWQKGLALATGELIWICESDDSCDKDFLKQIVHLFKDQSVRLAFGDIQFVDQAGELLEGMTHLRESAEPGIWDDVNVMPAARWFTGPLGVRNLIANVGGAVFRKPNFTQEVWDTTRTFRVAGDWYLYLMIAGGGQIAYSPDAKAYFRQHSLNTSVQAFEKPSFYAELEHFHIMLRQTWSVPRKVTLAFYGNLLETFEQSQLSNHHQIGDIVSLDRMLKAVKQKAHIAISFLNFNVGGGEIFPVELANLLHQRGYTVSTVVQTASSDNDFLRGWLHSDIPVYEADRILPAGPDLARDAGFDIIHSHNIWSEFFFLAKPGRSGFKYVSTLHGSYEVSNIEKFQVDNFFDRVEWAYLADRNLEKFQDFGFNTAQFKLIPNGMVRRLSAAPVTRETLGISADSFVFLFAARSHPEKGWRSAAMAFDRLCDETDRDVTLIMGGAGSEPDLIKEEFRHNQRIKLIGFRSDVDDLLGLSDALLLPTRFTGESMPLTLIQSILASVPIISTKVGQIESMLSCDMGSVGIAIEPDRDDEAFVSGLLTAMRHVLTGRFRADEAAFAQLAARFSLDACADRYIEMYGWQPARLAEATPRQDFASVQRSNEAKQVAAISARLPTVRRASDHKLSGGKTVKPVEDTILVTASDRAKKKRQQSSLSQER